MNYQTTIEIELALSSYFDIRKKLIVPNISWGFNIHECDLLVVSKSGYATEVEIKISKADLIKDLQKRHKHKSNKIKYLYFAIPSFLAKYIEYIPARAGIFVVTSKGRVKEIARPNLNIGCRKLTDKEMYKIARLGALRIWNLKKKIIKLSSNNLK